MGKASVTGKPAKLARLAAAGAMLWLLFSGCACCSRPCGSFWDRWPDEGSSPAGPGCCKPGAMAGGADSPDGYYNHPRFHPVPTQPVFTPRPEPLAAAPPDHLNDLESVPPGVPNRLPPPIAPEPIPSPAPMPPQSKAGENRGTGSDSWHEYAADRAAATPTDADTWLFSPASPPSASRHKEPVIEVSSDSSAVDQRTLR